MAAVNPGADSSLRRETGLAAALGHILMDPVPFSVDGPWEHWPSAARARAFGAMLLMPEGGLRDLLSGKTVIDAADVARVMERFGTGPHATTYHLKNLGFIDEERRAAVLRELDYVTEGKLLARFHRAYARDGLIVVRPAVKGGKK